MKHTPPYLIGLAGQSGAGKNAAARFLAEKGFNIIDADDLTHRVLQEQQGDLISRYAADAARKGLSLAASDGSLDRKALGALLFSDSTLLAAHEAFILPKIEAEIRRLIRGLLETAPDVPIVLNAPTLHKTSLAAECRFILYIHAPFLIRFIRCKKRDKVSVYRIALRFLQQKHFLSQYLLQNADIVRVKNAGTLHSLKGKIDRILQEKGF
ncbi:MAG: dephospho-CoA kinase [Treponema sp.]